LIRSAYFAPPLRRWSQAGIDVLKSAGAAGLAWTIAQRALGHQEPFFAAIAAVVCLSPGVVSHGKQAIGMLVGVTIGITVGEMALQISGFDPALRIALVTLIAMMAAATFGLSAVMVIQAGASAILVVASGEANAGLDRLTDAFIGGMLGLTSSQLLFTPDKLGALNDEARHLFTAIGNGLETSAKALRAGDAAALAAARDLFLDAQETAVGLRHEIAATRGVMRWTARGRLTSDRLAAVVNRTERPAIELASAALLFGEGLVSAMRDGQPSPTGLDARIERLARRCQRLGANDVLEAPDRHQAGSPDLRSVPWQRCEGDLSRLEEIVQSFES
jgi:uncharacterized membrane protein YgaE (UPF0421/DUF939 family)